MFGTSIRGKRLAAAVAVLTALGACVPMQPGSFPPPGNGAPPAPQVQRQTFNDPRVGGRWLDVCLAHGACREQQAVNMFCRQQGFQRAVSHQSRVTPLLQENVRIGDQSVCLAAAGNCHRVTTVTCQRSV